jgi:hypothetical protein
MQLVPDELLHQIVARTLAHGGATFDLATLAFESPGDFWYFPRYPSRTRIVDQRRLPEEIPAFIERNREVCTGADLWLGTWINPQSGQCYLDLTMRLAGKDQALREARRVSEADGRKIVTMYNPGLGRTEYVWAGIRF